MLVPQQSQSYRLVKSPWPKVRLRGSRAAGMAFQRKTVKWLQRNQISLGLTRVLPDLWVRAPDGSLNSPDVVCLTSTYGIVIECKLRRNLAARDQLVRYLRCVLGLGLAERWVLVHAFRWHDGAPARGGTAAEGPPWQGLAVPNPSVIYDWHLLEV